MTNLITVEYIWLDSNKRCRSKTRVMDIVNITLESISEWSYDGSSTNQASGENSEIVIKPRALFKDPFRNNGYLVICDTYLTNGSPTVDNTRYIANNIFNKNKNIEPWFGLEQEYVIYDSNTNRPLGWPIDKDPEPQGRYYCGVGSHMYGRCIVENHLEYCIYAGVKISGINAEVMASQWEFQIGPCTGIESGDHMLCSKYILERIAERYNCYISYNPKPESNDWNGSGCHMNYSSKEMRDVNGFPYIMQAIKKLSTKHMEHINNYGDNSKRMTGSHETSLIDKFTYGVSSRTTSIRIPYFVPINNRGYFEDRRPASDCDPYVITSLLFKTIHLD